MISFAFITILRPMQWLKNLIIFFPSFLHGSFDRLDILTSGMIPFSAFCLASSSTYIFNDIADIKYDREHPVKMNRPLPSGAVSPGVAAVFSVLLLALSIILAVKVSIIFLGYIIAYIAVSLAYSFQLKHFPLLDIFCISSGFILRLMAGGEAFSISVSDWLFLSVFLLALFLSTGKRLSEKASLGQSAGNHRKVLIRYPEGFLDGLLHMTGSAVLVTYSMYTVNRHSTLLLYTVPLCCFGLMRYLLRVKSGLGGDPTESLVRDLPLLATGLLWVIMVGMGIYCP